MAGLQRSAVSFRRQGSSGLVWDDRFFSGELKPTTKRSNEEQHNVVFLSGELRPSRIGGSGGGGGPTFERTRSTAAYRMEAISPSPSPSTGDKSPKFAGCGFCGVFGRPTGGNRQQKSNKRRSE